MISMPLKSHIQTHPTTAQPTTAQPTRQPTNQQPTTNNHQIPSQTPVQDISTPGTNTSYRYAAHLVSTTAY
jgi:hypothetical protein